MQRRIALKRLTASDLTLFEWQFRNQKTGGNQKSINLNADVFVSKLFPALPDAAAELNGRIPLDLYIYGPGLAPVHNLQRKIVKTGSYKNWRLNGEYIPNPEDQKDRFNVLQPNDFAVFDFRGRIIPTSAKLLLVSQAMPADSLVYKGLAALLGNKSMIAVSIAELQLIASGLDEESHPFHELTLDAALEDAALGGPRGMAALGRTRAGRTLNQEELERARRKAAEVGRAGEELVFQHFNELKGKGEILSFVWSSNQNAIAPYDFLVTFPDKREIAVDVKSTSGEFERSIHLSLAELREMTGGRRYDLYRLFELSEVSGRLRIAEDVGSFAESVLQGLRNLPKGVQVDSVSVDVAFLQFGSPLEVLVTISDED